MRRRRILFAAPVAIALVALVWLVLSAREPRYHGRRLSDWLEAGYNAPVMSFTFGTNLVTAYRPGVLPPNLPPGALSGYLASNYDPLALPNAGEAVRAVGVRAIPTLLTMLQADDTPFKLKLLALAQKQHFFKVNHVAAADWNRIAENAFVQLGTNASSAASAVVKIYEQNFSPSSRRAAVEVLGAMGPGIDPAARVMLTDMFQDIKKTDFGVRRDAMFLLAQIHSEAKTTVPVFVALLKDSDEFIRGNAAYDLGSLGADARPAVPALLEALHDMTANVQSAAAAALIKIDPEAAAKAGLRQ